MAADFAHFLEHGAVIPWADSLQTESFFKQAKRQASKSTAILSRGRIAGQGEDGPQRARAADVARLRRRSRRRAAPQARRKEGAAGRRSTTSSVASSCWDSARWRPARGHHQTPHAVHTLYAHMSTCCASEASARPRARSQALATNFICVADASLSRITSKGGDASSDENLGECSKLLSAKLASGGQSEVARKVPPNTKSE